MKRAIQFLGCWICAVSLGIAFAGAGVIFDAPGRAEMVIAQK